MAKKSAKPEVPKQDPQRGRRLQKWSYAIGVLIFLLFIFVGMPLLDARNTPAQLLFIAVIFVLIIWASILYQTGDQHFQPTADELMDQDGRPPILYLRSFDSDDDVFIEEIVLAEIISEVGPFVAIGRPGDELPPLGASRRYITNSAWKPHVRNLLKRSSMVILVAGKTKGLGWEVSQCRHLVDPEDLVILVPRKRKTYEEFRQLVKQSGINLSLPPHPSRRKAPYHAGEFCALIAFDRNWNGHLKPFEKAAWVGSKPFFAGRDTSMEERLRLAFGQTNTLTGGTIEMPGRNWLKIGMWGYWWFVFAFFIIAGILGFSGYLGPAWG